MNALFRTHGESATLANEVLNVHRLVVISCGVRIQKIAVIYTFGLWRARFSTQQLSRHNDNECTSEKFII